MLFSEIPYNELLMLLFLVLKANSEIAQINLFFAIDLLAFLKFWTRVVYMSLPLVGSKC